MPKTKNCITEYPVSGSHGNQPQQKGHRFSALLQRDGIFSEGYGVLPKAIMLDTALSCEAKAIYAYLCSFAGDKAVCCPGHKKMLADLNICSDAFYHHYHNLTEQGYLIVVRQSRANNNTDHHGFAPNSYYLNPYPEKHNTAANQSSDTGNDKAALQNSVRSAGYGFIAKKVMCDRALSIKAKALYAFYAAFAGTEFCAFPDRDTVLYRMRLGEKTMQRYNRELVAQGWLTVSQTVKNGRFGRNLYRLAGYAQMQSITEKEPNNKKQTPNHTPADVKKPCTLYSCSVTNPTEVLFSDGTKQELPISQMPNMQTNNKNLKNTTPKITNRKKKTNFKSSQVSITQQKKKEQKNSRIDYNTHAKRMFRLYYPAFTPKKYSIQQQQNMDEVATYLLENRCCNPEWCLDKQKLEALAYILCEDEFMGVPERYDFLPNGEQALQLHKNLITAFEQLVSGRFCLLGGKPISAQQILQKISGCLRFIDTDGITLGSIPEAVKANYQKAANSTLIHSPAAYLANCVWNALNDPDNRVSAQAVGTDKIAR